MVDASLGLPTGKLAAQVAHASVGALLHARREAQAAWFEAGMPKIVLSCASAQDLLDITAEAERAGLPVLLVRDAGRTVVQAGTATCVGVGPAPAGDIDAITGRLALLP